MRFDDLDAKMRLFETAHDLCVLPEVFMVARLDGRSFTRLTKEVWDLDRPFGAAYAAFIRALPAPVEKED